MLRRVAGPLWRRLPRRLRRHVFVQATALTAPRPDPAAAHGGPQEPVTVGGVFRASSGLGESARMNLAGLRHAGVAVRQLDLSETLLGTVDLPPVEAPAAQPGRGTLVLHVSGPFVPYALRSAGASMVAGKRIVGFWHWELPRLAPEWRAGCRFVHEVWVPSRFCAEAVRAMFDGPVRVIPHPVSVQGAPPENTGLAPGRGRPFTVVTMFNMASGFERKNPLATVRAFRAAFGDDPGARLRIKVLKADHYPQGARRLAEAVEGLRTVELVTDLMSRAEVLALLAGADAVTSLHRSEGFGLLAAEAMLLGRPVLATDWSATTDFLDAATGIPIPYRLVPAVDPQGNYHDPSQHWAEPDVEAAAAWLVRLRAEPDLAAAIGAAGQAAAQRLFGMEAYAAALRQALAGP